MSGLAQSPGSKAVFTRPAVVEASAVPSVESMPQPIALARRTLKAFAATSVVPYLAHKAHYIGRTGVTGVGLLVFALAFFLGAVSPLKNQLPELQAGLEKAKLQTRSVDSEKTSDAALRELVGSLPMRDQLPVITGQIVEEAGNAGLALERGSYDFSIARSGHLVRARMTFPVRGAYPSIRKFIDSTLTRVPGAAIEGLRLGRKDIGASQIDAEVRFVVYLRAGP